VQLRVLAIPQSNTKNILVYLGVLVLSWQQYYPAVSVIFLNFAEDEVA
jgi:hypothetical protein